VANRTRTCVTCREACDASELVRIVVAPNGEAVVDLRGKLPGRGAWLHPRVQCVERVVRRPAALRRALKAPGIELSSLDVAIRGAVVRASLDALALCARSGSLVGGHDALVRALRDGKVIAVAIANDAAPRTIKDLRAAMGREVPFVEIPLTRDALGQQIGRGPRAAVGAIPSAGGQYLRDQLRRLTELG